MRDQASRVPASSWAVLTRGLLAAYALRKWAISQPSAAEAMPANPTNRNVVFVQLAITAPDVPVMSGIDISTLRKVERMTCVSGGRLS